MNLKHLPTILCALLVIAAPATVAEDDNSIISNVLVTASRIPERAAQRAASSIIIDRQQIELQNANDLAELLRFHAGLDIGRNGGPGQVASVFVRGAESNHLMVLVDGVRINPGTIGVSAIQNIDPDLIERIEIVKGPRATLYGSDAIGAVVNVITRANNQPKRSSFSMGGGSFNTVDINAGQGFGSRDMGGNVAISWHDTDGFNSRTDASDDHGYQNTTMHASGWRQFDQVRAELNYWRSQGNTEYAGFSLEPLDQDYTNQTVDLRFVSRIRDNWNSELSIAHVIDDIEQNQPAFDGNYDFLTTKRVSADWLNTFQVNAESIVLLGLYGYKEQADVLSFGLPFDEDTSVYAAYSEYNLQKDRSSLSVAARHTDHDDFGTAFTWHADAGFHITPTLQLIAAAGTGFRAPDATDRFGFGGNQNLDPEVSTTLELGVRYQFSDNHVISARAFEQKIDDLINYVVTDFVTFAGTNQNIDHTSTDGIELSHQFSHGNFSVLSEMTWQDPIDKSTGLVLLRRAKRSFTTNMNYTFAVGTLGLSVLAAGERPDIDSATFSRVTSPGYVLANVNYSRPITQNWVVRAKIENFLDTNYETADGFNNAKRSYFVEFAFNP